ncbi:MAG: sulfite exporter TauE/SafE family protein [Dehalococcoidia bacterium]|nr:sulfite exporter TauE/SafE family protein [Dehalococcoidia bacterium]
MDALEAVGLFAAAFAAGAINAVAGGGSLISFPALVAAGYAAKTANVTNTVALWPGYLGGSLNYRSELSRQRRRVLLLLLPAVLGALAGSAVLLATSEDAFEVVVPFLILFAAGLMLFQERLAAFAATHHLRSRGEGHVPVLLLAVTFLGAIYGAYFGAGLGIILLAFLSILLPDDVQHSNALKGMLSLMINAVAVASFAAFGPVEWRPALLMAVGALAGGYLGVYAARALGAAWLRRAVVVYGVVVAAVLFARL